MEIWKISNVSCLFIFIWITTLNVQGQNDATIESYVTCGGGDVSITCPTGHSIIIVNVTHGRSDDTTCVTNSLSDVTNVTCELEGASRLLRDECNDQESCFVAADNITALNTCDVSEPYLSYSYACSNCTNAHGDDSECTIWAWEGNCDSFVYSSWMSVNCRKACHLCPGHGCLASNKQSFANCEFWTRIGQCQTNPDFMMNNCEKSCTCPVNVEVLLTPSIRAIDVSRNQLGGVMKDIHRPGYGHDYPPEGAVLYTHYHGQLNNGSRFDASRVREIMFVFTVGVGRVILGWDYGLPTMKRGEVATLYIKPEYAYGDNGFFTVIGPRETLAIEVQLYDWRVTCTNYFEYDFVTEESCNKALLDGGCETDYWRLYCKRTCNACDMPETCVNVHTNNTQCDVWALEGECDFDNALWMLDNCARSCGHCPEDPQSLDNCRNLQPIEANCDYWASIGECTDESSGSYMAGSCARTCGFCTPQQQTPKDPTCVNLHANETECGLWAYAGQCVEPGQQDFMDESCARFCNNCDRGTCANIGVLSDVKCDYWASQGECERNRDFMSVNCRRSCQRCVEIPDGCIDVSPDTNGGIYKCVERQGVGPENKPLGGVIYSHYNGTLANGTNFGTSRDAGRMWTYVFGVTPQEVIDGWKYAVPTMRRGEKATVTMQSEYAYKVSGTGGSIPPNAELTIVIEIFDWRDTCSNKRSGTECDDLAATGTCEADPDMMNIYCKRSCNTCAQPESCQNLNTDADCDYWSNIGECDLNYSWMLTNCPRSCGICDHLDECKNRHTHVENCHYWRSQGECAAQTSARWMEANCRQTCDFCDSAPACMNHAGDEICESWATAGECDLNYSYMSNNCTLACDRCHLVPPPGITCGNSHQECNSWSQQGECDSNPDWMSVNCPLACNATCPEEVSCTNSFANCNSWADQGECESNVDWMNDNCVLSCNPACQTTTPEVSCNNSFANCNSWADQGECESNVDWMNDNCVLSCNPACQTTTPEVSCENSLNDCIVWAEQGECGNNVDWMSVNCALSCNTACATPGPVPSDDCFNVDDDVMCDTLASMRGCANNITMLTNCKKSCSVCVTTDSDYCFNNYTEALLYDCQYFVSEGECTRSASSRQWMLTYCRRECTECAETMPHVRQTICDNESYEMFCNAGYYLQTKAVFYGRENNMTCSSNQTQTVPETCSSRDVYDVVSADCNGRSSCNVTASTDLWTDPCPGIDKYAILEYTCLRCLNVYDDVMCEAERSAGHCTDPFIANSCFKTCSGCSSETNISQPATTTTTTTSRPATTSTTTTQPTTTTTSTTSRPTTTTTTRPTTTTSRPATTTTTITRTTTSSGSLSSEQLRCTGNACVHGRCVSPTLTDHYLGMRYRCVCDPQYTGILCNVVKATACDWCMGADRLCVTSVSSMSGSFCYDSTTWEYISST